MLGTPTTPSGTVAYFSMEIGLAPDLPTYSGGLGILAGDTLLVLTEEEIFQQVNDQIGRTERKEGTLG